MFRPLSLLPLALIQWLSYSQAVSIYTTLPWESTATSTPSPVPSSYTGYAAFNPMTLNAPAPPSPPQPNTVPVQLWSGGMPGLSILQKGNFLGLSVEFSVASQIIGKNSSLLNVPFLNYLANIHVRAGAGPIVRVGGTSQDTSTLIPSGLLDGVDEINNIQTGGPDGSVSTTDFSPALLYAMSNISALVGTQWYLGLSFNSTQADENTLLVAQYAENILGRNLVALELGNEPDQYGKKGKRPAGYTVADYMLDFEKVVVDLNGTSGVENKDILIGPSVCCDWTIQEVLDAGYISQFAHDLAQVSVHHYPESNCQSAANQPQELFPSYLNHSAATSFAQPYLNASQELLEAGKPFIMLETNTASCGGFLGISDSFGATLWAVDMALQLAATNFSHALLHNSGANVYYNPITPPPGNETHIKQWNTGSTYYAMLAVAETFGSSNASQIVDLETSNGSPFTPAYAIYEDGQPTRVALFNFVSDSSGANDYEAVIAVGGGQTGQPNATPSNVTVRYLSAPTVSEKYNITWAGQTLGGAPQISDGRLQGDVITETIQCDTSNGTCTISVRAPSFALVFLTMEALQASSPEPWLSLSYSSTATANGRTTSSTVNPSVLATSNGHGGSNGLPLGSSARESGGVCATIGLWTLIAILSTTMWTLTANGTIR